MLYLHSFRGLIFDAAQVDPAVAIAPASGVADDVDVQCGPEHARTTVRLFRDLAADPIRRRRAQRFLLGEWLRAGLLKRQSASLYVAQNHADRERDPAGAIIIGLVSSERRPPSLAPPFNSPIPRQGNFVGSRVSRSVLRDLLDDTPTSEVVIAGQKWSLFEVDEHEDVLRISRSAEITIDGVDVGEAPVFAALHTRPSLGALPVGLVFPPLSDLDSVTPHADAASDGPRSAL